MASVKNKFKFSLTAEQKFMRQLTSVAKEVAKLMRPHLRDGKIIDSDTMDRVLVLYSQSIDHWASSVAAHTVQTLENRTKAEWKRHSTQVAHFLKQHLESSPINQILKNIHDRQKNYIKSLPIEAGLRVHDLSRRAVVEGYSRDHVEQLLSADENLQVTTSRAKLIARTEIARANAQIVEAQAEFAEVDYYIWRTLLDEVVRPTHAVLEGKIFRFDSPPEIPGEGAHGPGQFCNCRCYAEPIIPAAAKEYSELKDYPDILKELDLEMAA